MDRKGHMFFPGARDKVDSAAVSELVRDEPVARRQSLIRISTHTLSNANTNTDTDAYSNKYRSVLKKDPQFGNCEESFGR